MLLEEVLFVFEVLLVDEVLVRGKEVVEFRVELFFVELVELVIFDNYPVLFDVAFYLFEFVVEIY